MSDLPPEIITTILVRLPVKSLLRFRCVSKPWRSLIDGKDLIKLHLRHSAETIIDRTLIVQSVHHHLKFDLDSLEQLDIGNILQIVKVKGSCNGLVLLVSFSDKFFLWNPNTRKLNDLPPPPPPPSPKAGECWSVRSELGYDSKHDDYKVVRVVQSGSSNGVCLYSQTTIYSLKTNSWKKAAGDFPHELMHGRSGCVYLNDALHFVVQHHFGSEMKIMAFDLAKEEYNEVPKPESAAGRVGFSLASAGGCLLFVVGNLSGEVWVMKEFGVKGSWCKLANCFDDPKEDCMSLRTLAFSEDGFELLFIYYEGTRCYRLGNLNNVTVAHVEGSSGFLDVDVVFGRSFSAWVCVASLVSPFSP